MKTPSEICFKTITEMAPQIRSLEISPVDLTKMQLDRIASLDGTLHSYLTVMQDQALASARIAEDEIKQGNYKGPLHGIPVALKDLIYLEGIPTSCASGVLSDFIPEFSATVARKLEQAGAIVLGKLNMTEFALNGYHPDFEVPQNPWNLDHWSGVSSSGSGAATAAHLCFGSLGTDTGGSIRFPSAANGVVGLKPTYGLVSRYGVFPLADSLDHVGPITRSVSDAAIMLNAIAGYDDKDPTSISQDPVDYRARLNEGVKGLVIGVDEKYIAENSDPQVTATVLKARDTLVSLGASTKAIDLSGINEVCGYWGMITGVEAAIGHQATYPAKKELYGPVFKGLLEAAHSVFSAVDVAKGYAAGTRVKHILRQQMQGVDFILCPSMPMVTPTAQEMTEEMPPEAMAAALLYAAPFNFSGNPTISLPCGFSENRLPISLQLVGHHLGEQTIIQAANSYEQATHWHREIAPTALK